MGSSNVSEDGASERVRFDNIVYYSMDESIEKVIIKKTDTFYLCVLIKLNESLN